MKKIFLITTTLASLVFANSAQELFNTKCAVCHKVEVEDKNTLIAPPIDKVVMHVKRSFADKNESIAFMKDYVINPDANKTVCPSIDIFGVMPSQKDVVKDDELALILDYIYDNFGQKGMRGGASKNQMNKGMGRGNGKGMGRGFGRIDSDGDGFVSKDEFKAFRAKKEGIDIKKIKYDYFFNKLDKDKDGKLSKEEFMSFKNMIKDEF